MIDLNLEILVQGASSGDAEAAEASLYGLIDDVYTIAVRMLWHPKDAEDAAESVLSAALRQFPSFPADGGVRPDVFRAAVKGLLNVPKSPVERQRWTFEAQAEDLARGLGEPVPPSLPPRTQPSLVEELKIGCTQMMLQCLDREHRLAYIIGEILGQKNESAAEALELDQVTFARRLARARERMGTFMTTRCGLVNAEATCRCSARLGRSLLTGRVNQRRLLFVVPAADDVTPDSGGGASDPARVFREQRLRRAPETLVAKVWQCVSPGHDDDPV